MADVLEHTHLQGAYTRCSLRPQLYDCQHIRNLRFRPPASATLLDEFAHRMLTARAALSIHVRLLFFDPAEKLSASKNIKDTAMPKRMAKAANVVTDVYCRLKADTRLRRSKKRWASADPNTFGSIVM